LKESTLQDVQRPIRARLLRQAEARQRPWCRRPASSSPSDNSVALLVSSRCSSTSPSSPPCPVPPCRRAPASAAAPLLTAGDSGDLLVQRRPQMAPRITPRPTHAAARSRTRSSAVAVLDLARWCHFSPFYSFPKLFSIVNKYMIGGA
jgi:hypothetical protein